MKKILVVDDEKPISDIVKFSLTKEGFEVITAFDGEEGLVVFNEKNPDLVILDLMLPKMDGLEVCREIRKTSNVPIIMVTAKDSEIDKVFSNRELIARVKANLRRQQLAPAEAEEEKTANEIVLGSLIIHEDAYVVSKRGEEIELTHREFELLHYLAKHIGQVITREHLLQTVWGYDYFGDVRTVDVTVRRLREKIEDTPSHPTWIMTRRGVGYYIKTPDQEKEA